MEDQETLTPAPVEVESEAVTPPEPVGVESSVAGQASTRETDDRATDAPAADPVAAVAPDTGVPPGPAKAVRVRPAARPFVKPSDEELAELRKRRGGQCEVSSRA